MNRAIILCSGGLDSTVLAYKLMRDHVPILPLFVDYGQHCAETELRTVKKVLPESLRYQIETIDLSSVYKHSKSRLIVEADLWSERVKDDDLYVPLRNLLIFTAGAAFAQSVGASDLYAAIINTVRAKEVDCSVDFFAKLHDVLGVYDAVQLHLPFRNMSKLEVARLGAQLAAPIAETFSCQASSEIPCGACPNCVERLNAFEEMSKDV